MILYPAIDLKDGAVVRLLRGEMDSATIYNDDPAAQARSFVAAGCTWLHLVDLDGAFAGRPVNTAAVEAILAACPDTRVQLGGGIRDMAGVEGWLEKGVARVILGTAAVEDPDFVRAACAAHPGRIALGIDARDGRVATRGWAETTTMQAVDLAAHYERAGVAAVIYTDIQRDGAMAGPNVLETERLARATGMEVIASGGVSSIPDLQALKATDSIAGAIIGRALYDGSVDLGLALSVLRD